jgi:hypothetical protein
MRILYYTLIILTLFSSCKKNKYIIPRKPFKNILIELHLADGVYMMNYGKYQIHTDSLNFYNTIFKNYGYTRAQFDSTLKYYTVHPKEFDLIYDGVITELNMLVEEVTQIRDFESDSLDNQFTLRTRWSLPSDGKTTRIPFDIKVKDSAEYTINVYAKKYPDDQSKNLRISAFYQYTDTVSKEIKTEEFPEISYSVDKYYNLYTTTKIYTHKKSGRLRGWILNHDEQKAPFAKHVDIKMIYIKKKLLLRKR